MAEGIHSTGRGGAGNIGQDPTIYTDGSIVREGAQGVSLEGEYSTGRGGSGNIGPGASTPQAQRQSLATGRRPSEDFIPEPAMREVQTNQNFHTGRGGGGNVHKEKYGGHSDAKSEAAATAAGGDNNNNNNNKPSVGEKLKNVLGIGKDRSRSRSRGRPE